MGSGDHACTAGADRSGALPVVFGAVLDRGGYHIFDLNGSVAMTDQLEVGLFAKNLFNRHGILNAPFSFAGSVTRPRTIGATLRFDLNWGGPRSAAGRRGGPVSEA